MLIHIKTFFFLVGKGLLFCFVFLVFFFSPPLENGSVSFSLMPIEYL